MSDLKDELEQERREKEWAETWKPDGPGDMLIGTLQAYDEATTDFGTYRVAHIRDEEGVLRGLWLMHSVLQDEWEEADPGVGERVGVQYLGQRSGDTYDYHMWTVKVDRPEDAPQETAEDDTAGAEATANRQPQDRSAEQESGAGDFDGSDLWGEPAVDAESREEAPQEPEGESTLDDPNGGLPF
jgi:hypothetical protein